MTRDDVKRTLTADYPEEDVLEQALFMKEHYDTIDRNKHQNPSENITAQYVPASGKAHKGKLALNKHYRDPNAEQVEPLTDIDQHLLDNTIKKVAAKAVATSPLSGTTAVAGSPSTYSDVIHVDPSSLETKPRVSAAQRPLVGAPVPTAPAPATGSDGMTVEEYEQQQLSQSASLSIEDYEKQRADSGAVSPLAIMTELTPEQVMGYTQHVMDTSPGKPLATKVLRDIQKQFPEVTADPNNLLTIKRYLDNPTVYSESPGTLSGGWNSLGITGSNLAGGFGQTAGGIEKLFGRGVEALGDVGGYLGTQMGIDTGVSDAIVASGQSVAKDADSVMDYWGDITTGDTATETVGRSLPLLTEGFIAPAIGAAGEQYGKGATGAQALSMGVLTGAVSKAAQLLSKAFGNNLIDMGGEPSAIADDMMMTPELQPLYKQLSKMSNDIGMSIDDLIQRVQQFSVGSKLKSSEDFLRQAGDVTGTTPKILEKMPWLKGSRAGQVDRVEQAGGPIVGGHPGQSYADDGLSAFVDDYKIGLKSKKMHTDPLSAIEQALRLKTGGLSSLLTSMVRDFAYKLKTPARDRIAHDIEQQIVKSLEKGHVPITDEKALMNYLVEMVKGATAAANAYTEKK